MREKAAASSAGKVQPKAAAAGEWASALSAGEQMAKQLAAEEGVGSCRRRWKLLLPCRR